MTLLLERTIQNRIMSGMAKSSWGNSELLCELRTVSPGNHQKHNCTEQNESNGGGFSTHIKRLIQNHWWTKQQCQFLYNLIPSRHLLLATCCWGYIGFTIMKFFLFTDGDMPGRQHSFCGLQASVCAFVCMGFPPCVVLGPQCPPLWEITVRMYNYRTGQDAQESFALPLCTLSLEAYYII